MSLPYRLTRRIKGRCAKRQPWPGHRSTDSQSADVSPPCRVGEALRVESRDHSAVDEAKRAQNQLVFRQTNEQIRDVVDDLEPGLPEVPVVCECSDPRCRRLLGVPMDVYGWVRESPTRFLHALDHRDDGTSSKVVQVFDGFVVLEKQGTAAKVAERGRESEASSDG